MCVFLSLIHFTSDQNVNVELVNLYIHCTFVKLLIQILNV